MNTNEGESAAPEVPPAASPARAAHDLHARLAALYAAGSFAVGVAEPKDGAASLVVYYGQTRRRDRRFEADVPASVRGIPVRVVPGGLPGAVGGADR